MTIVVEAAKTSEAAIKGESIGDVLSIQARPLPTQPIRPMQPGVQIGIPQPVKG